MYVCVLTVGSSNAQADGNSVADVDSATINYIVELVDNSIITGKKVSDDGREIGIHTSDKGLVLIPKYKIMLMTVASGDPKSIGNRYFPNPHPSKYSYSPSGIGINKGEGYFQTIYLLIYQVQYALTNHWSVGLTTSILGTPTLLNVKYTNVILESKDRQRNLYVAAGTQAGLLHFFSFEDKLGIGYAGLTFGNSESNITVSGGVFADNFNVYSGGNITTTPAISASFNQRVDKSISIMGEFWMVGDYLIGGPGFRFYSGKKERGVLDLALLGYNNSAGTTKFFGLPFLSWTKKLGGN